MLLLSRVAKSRPGQEPFIRDLQMLTAFIRNLRDALDSQTLRREFEVDELGKPKRFLFSRFVPDIPDYRMNHEVMSAISFFS